LDPEDGLWRMTMKYVLAIVISVAILVLWVFVQMIFPGLSIGKGDFLLSRIVGFLFLSWIVWVWRWSIKRKS